MQQLKQFVAADTKRLHGRIEIKAVAGFVLHLGQENGLALQRRRARDPVAFRQLTDNFRMGMLTDLTDQGLAIAFRHPFLRFDLLAAINALLKCAFFRAHFLQRFAAFGLYHLCVHDYLLPVQILSMIIAIPCPTPMHMVQRA